MVRTGLANLVCCSICQEQFFGGFVDLASISSFVVFLVGKLCCSAADSAFGFLMHGVWFPFSSLSE